MAIQIHKAERKKAKLRIGLGSAPGAGKTYSALLMASGLTSWDKIVMIDSENGSGELYANLGGYSVITLKDPFSPEKYIEAIKASEDAGFEVIIIDSMSHSWEYLLEEHSKMQGNSFSNWSKITPRYNALVQSILQSKCHVITTTRRKPDYSMDKDSTGKTVITKLGMKEVQRDTYSFELTLDFSIDQGHYATVEKDRTELFVDKPSFKITKETGIALLQWAESGKEVEYEPTETKDPVTQSALDKLTAKADLDTINSVCGLKLKKIEHITQSQAMACLTKLMTLNK